MKNKSRNIAFALLATFIASTPAQSNPFRELMSGRNLARSLALYPLIPAHNDLTARLPLSTYFNTMPTRNFYFGTHLTIEYGQPRACIPQAPPQNTRAFTVTVSVETDRDSMYSLSFSRSIPNRW